MQKWENDGPFISGFTMVKNGLSLGYPIRESIESIAPLCDEVIINVGFEDKNCTKDDGTYLYLKNYFVHKKFFFMKSYWDPKLSAQGLILSEQTNLALAKCRGKYCQYIQGDEVVHEEDLKTIHNEVIKMENNPHLNGLIFKYHHFYGNVDVLKHTRSSYRREVRLIRNNREIYSYLDAQGFRFADGRKIMAKQISASIYHYGWARKEEVMDKKNKSFGKLYHGENHLEERFYYGRIWGLKKFKKRHPMVMKKWVATNRNELDLLNMPLKWEWKNIGLAISDFLEFLTGYRLGEFKNFKEL